VVKDSVNDVFKIGKEPVDRVSQRWLIEAAAQPNNRVPKLSFNETNAVDVMVVAVEGAAHHLWWLMLSCSPLLRWGNHVELFEKLVGTLL
jgi:hypothetical protein